MSDMTERRVKVFCVPEREVFGLLGRRWRDLDRDVLVLYSPECVPADAEVVSVRHDPMRRAFLFLIGHPSFDAVAEGDVPPDAGRLGVETLSVAIDRQSGTRLAYGYRQLLAENERLRGIFGDLRQDDAAIRAAYEQGRADLHREFDEATPVRLVFDKPPETEETRRALDHLARHIDNLMAEYNMRNQPPVILPNNVQWSEYPTKDEVTSE